MTREQRETRRMFRHMCWLSILIPLALLLLLHFALRAA